MLTLQPTALAAETQQQLLDPQRWRPQHLLLLLVAAAVRGGVGGAEIESSIGVALQPVRNNACVMQPRRALARAIVGYA